MPFTREIDPYSVIVSSDRRPRGGWEAQADIVTTGTPAAPVATVREEARTLAAAEARAFAKARRWCRERWLRRKARPGKRPRALRRPSR
jgi:hypothetical protein